MKNVRSILVLTMLILSAIAATAQKMPDSSNINSSKTYLVIKNDGTEFVGKLVSMDAREILIDTKNMGQVSIPKHEVKQMKEVGHDDLTYTGEYKPTEAFATRYFLTTNGLPIEKGESYVLWNWFGPDIQFGVAKNFGIGVMTTWLAIPVVASAKYSIELDNNTHLALGALLGTGSWAAPQFGLAVPFASLTYGDRRANITLSGGYGSVWTEAGSGGRSLFSVAAMAKVSKKATLVFDSFIMPGNTSSGDNAKSYTAIYMPGIRLQTVSNKAFQFGFAGIEVEGKFSPIPMVQWFRMF